ncbi:unnamed protein product [Paramecium sonneborni]|uniref:Uncharacterized protein n=1 Tax=Paramecium sonneborni TaxID=65129 RepID=A0A8S1R018_9CILI|nr:unnamed protein product [Paramecium sonneborni]
MQFNLQKVGLAQIMDSLTKRRASSQQNQKSNERRSLNMIESIFKEKGLTLRVNQQGIYYVQLGYSFVVDASLQIKKDKIICERFFLKDVLIRIWQNILINEKIIFNKTRHVIKGCIIFHTDEDMKFFSGDQKEMNQMIKDYWQKTNYLQLCIILLQNKRDGRN